MASSSDELSKSHQVELNGELHPYLISHSKRAKYIRIKLSPDGVITLVIPKGVSMRNAQQFFSSKITWLEQHVQNLPVPKAFAESRPESLSLALLDECWAIEYHYFDSDVVTLEVKPDFNLVLTGPIDNKALVLKSIGEWLKAKAQQVLPDQLSLLAEQHGFHYNRVTIRGQKTRWGSCSSQKNINLNYKLLFLDQHLVDYVLIHELCHTIEMNHSSRFWNLVADCDENYQQHDRMINQVGRSIPI